MNKKNTEELENAIRDTNLSKYEDFISLNKPYLIDKEYAFGSFLKELFREKRITQKKVFLRADIPEAYGYKLLSGEKRTKQRDIILRICYGAGFTLLETQKALKIYEMPQLYPKIPRDILLMIMFNERPGSIIDINEIMENNSVDPLRECGKQEF